MNAYAGVVTHPFFAVTKEDGSFEIKGLPAGTYTIEMWHEQLGTQTQSVTVDGQTPAQDQRSLQTHDVALGCRLSPLSAASRAR